ncbi:MAG: ice-binding family protein [Fibrobacterota bacterium]
MKIKTKNTTAVLSRWTRFLGAMVTAALMLPTAAMAEPLAPVTLRSTANYAVLAGSLVSNVPTSAVTGDIGLSPAAGSNITGFGLLEVTGTIYTVDAAGPAGSVTAATELTAAKGDLTLAYNDAAGRTPIPTGPNLDPGSGNIGGLTLAAGLYKFTSNALITGSDLTLTGSATDVWIFQIASSLTVGDDIEVVLAGEAKASNIFWQVGTSAALGTTSIFKGTILADQSISMNTGATLDGRALARIAAVTLASNTITCPSPRVPISPTPVALRSISDFAVLAGFAVTSIGVTTVIGDLGVSPDSAVTGSPTVYGSIHAGDAVAAQAQLDLDTAYNDVLARSGGSMPVAGNLAGDTLVTGLYTSLSSLDISSGNLILDAQGDTNAVFIIKMASTLTTGTGSQVILINGARASNVIWQVGSSATLGATSVFKGIILASVSISMASGATLEGRALARTGTVALNGNTISSRLPEVTASPVIVDLGTADSFAVLSGTSVTSVNATAITGDLGVSPGTTVTGTPTMDGTIHTNDATAIQAQLDLDTAYDDAAGRTVGALMIAGNLGGQTLTPGLYTSTSTLAISSGDLTLDAQGDPDAVFIFQIASTLSTATGTHVILSDSAKASNIFWQVGSSATLGATSVFKGNILALDSITLESGVILDGRVLARNGAVTLDGDTITSRPATVIIAPPQALVALATAADFAVLAGTSVTSNNAVTLTGDLGVSPGVTVTGAPIVSGTTHLNDAIAIQAQLDLTIAYDDAAGRTVGAVTVAGNLGGDTLTPGLYTSTSSLAISTGDLTLDAAGDSDAVFIFQMASTLTTSLDRKVILINDARASNIFWQVGSSATLGANSVFEGTLLALTSITLEAGATLNGRALARTGTVTLDGNTVTTPPGPITVVENGLAADVSALSQNYPNPFNPSTKIQYSIKKAAQVSLKVYNALGHEVATLVNGRQEAGSHTVSFNSKKGTLSLSSGVYFCRLEAGSFVSMKKLVLIK